MSGPQLFPAPSPKHAELVRSAVRWLRATHKCSIVFAEMAPASGYYPDAIGWFMRFSILVECKVSRADFFADRKKLIHALPDNYPGEERWYLTPPGLVKPGEVPEGWWLAEAHEKSVRMVTHPSLTTQFESRPELAHNPNGWGRIHNRERMAAGVPFLLSAVRRHELGIRWLNGEAKFESDAARKRREAEGAERCDEEHEP